MSRTQYAFGFVIDAIGHPPIADAVTQQSCEREAFDGVVPSSSIRPNLAPVDALTRGDRHFGVLQPADERRTVQERKGSKGGQEVMAFSNAPKSA